MCSPLNMPRQYPGVGAWPIGISLVLSQKAYATEIKRLGVTNAVNYPGIYGGAVVLLTEIEEAGKPRHDQVVICLDLAERKKTHSKMEISSILVHEATHAWQYTKAAAEETNPGDETEAYFMQHLTYWLFEQVEAAWRAAA